MPIMVRSVATSVAVAATLFSMAAHAASFPDVSGPDAAGIAYLQENGIFQGKPQADGTFRFEPDAPLNRAELVTILVRALGLDVDLGNGSCFSDIHADAWYFRSVCTAEAMGLISGYPDGTFKPSRQVNKVEAIKIVVNALGMMSEVEMYASYKEGNEWYSPYLTLMREWNLLDAERVALKADAPFSRADASQLLYRGIITAMQRADSGELPVFSADLAATYGDKELAFHGKHEAALFAILAADNRLYRNENLGFSVRLPWKMLGYSCSQDIEPAVDLLTTQSGNVVYLHPEWYEDHEYLGENPDGSGKYGDCQRHDMNEDFDDYFARGITVATARNDAEISGFIKEHFGEDCGPFTTGPSLQSGVLDVRVTNVPRPGIEQPSDLGDLACVTNYGYILKYNPTTKRLLHMNLGQDGFIYVPNESGSHDTPLDWTIARTLRMF